MFENGKNYLVSGALINQILAMLNNRKDMAINDAGLFKQSGEAVFQSIQALNAEPITETAPAAVSAPLKKSKAKIRTRP